MPEVLRSKIHRAWVSQASPGFISSIVIDEALMERVGIEDTKTPVRPRMIQVDEGNQFVDYLEVL